MANKEKKSPADSFVSVVNSVWKRVLWCLSLIVITGGAGYTLYCNTNVARITNEESSSVMLTTFTDEPTLMNLMNFEAGEDEKVLFTSFDDNYIDINIKRGIPVNIIADGVEVTVTVNEGNVEDALNLAGIILDEDDYTVPTLHTPVKRNDIITIHRVEYVVNSYEETIPHGTTYRKSSLLYRAGRQKKTYTLREGSNGTKRLTYTERFVDGELVQSLLGKEEILKKPVDSVVLSYGAGVPVSNVSAPAGVSVSNGVPSGGYSRVLSMSASGYSAKKGKGASGLGLYYGTVAVNPNVIPYGTKMYIVSQDGRFVYGWAIATDTGTDMMEHGDHIDLFYETYTESVLNGRIAVNVYVYG